MQNISETPLENTTYTTKLQPDDLITISVNAPFPYEELAAPFQPVSQQLKLTDTKPDQNRIPGVDYIIDPDGNINMPVIGKVKLSGLTKAEAITALEEKLTPYIKNPIINLRILNYKFTILGEVARPGTYTVEDEKITLLQAFGVAGDLTLFGQRENILVIREKENVKTYNYIDITKADFINSDYYYVAQGDVIVIEPSRNARSQSAAGRNLTILVSGLSVLMTFVAIITR